MQDGFVETLADTVDLRVVRPGFGARYANRGEFQQPVRACIRNQKEEGEHHDPVSLGGSRFFAPLRGSPNKPPVCRGYKTSRTEAVATSYPIYSSLPAQSD